MPTADVDVLRLAELYGGTADAEPSAPAVPAPAADPAAAPLPVVVR